MFGKEQEHMFVNINGLRPARDAAMIVREIIMKEEYAERMKNEDARKAARQLLDLLLKEKFVDLCSNFVNTKQPRLRYVLKGREFSNFKEYVLRAAFVKEFEDVIKHLGYVDCRFEVGICSIDITIIIPEIKI
jgi:hypothetical protein